MPVTFPDNKAFMDEKLEKNVKETTYCNFFSVALFFGNESLSLTLK